MGKVDNIKAPKGVKVDLDRERHMRFTMAGMAYLTEKYGSPVAAFEKMQLMASDNVFALTKDTIEGITDILFACLCHEDRNLTPQDVQAMVGIDDFTDLVTVLSTVIGGSMPESKGAAGDGENP